MESTVQHSTTSQTLPLSAVRGPAPFFGDPNWVRDLAIPSSALVPPERRGDGRARTAGRITQGEWQKAPADVTLAGDGPAPRRGARPPFRLRRPRDACYGHATAGARWP